MSHLVPNENDLHAYVDGQLAPQARADVERWLAAHPEQASRVAAWKQDAERLRTDLALPGPWSAIPALEPHHLRRRLHARRRARLGVAAAVLLALGLGTGVGWQIKTTQLAATQRPMADAVSAYRLFAVADRNGGLDMTQQTQLKDWLSQHFGALGAMPDLQAQGFRLVGGQRLSTDQGAAAMLVYQDPQGARIGVYLRPAGRVRRQGQRRDGELLAQYWSHDNVAFAVVAPSADNRARDVASLLQPHG